MDEVDEVIRTGGPTNAREALAACHHTSSPAETVKALYLVVAYQQQQIEALEKAVGLQHAGAMEGIRERAHRLVMSESGLVDG